MFSKLLRNSYTRHHCCTHFQDENSNLCPLSDTITSLNLGASLLPRELGMLERLCQELPKRVLGAGSLSHHPPALPAPKQHKPWQAKEAEARSALPVTAALLILALRFTSPQARAESVAGAAVWVRLSCRSTSIKQTSQLSASDRVMWSQEIVLAVCYPMLY